MTERTEPKPIKSDPPPRKSQFEIIREIEESQRGHRRYPTSVNELGLRR